MSRLDELIAELCPDGVEYKELGEIGELIRGAGLQKKILWIMVLVVFIMGKFILIMVHLLIKLNLLLMKN